MVMPEPMPPSRYAPSAGSFEVPAVRLMTPSEQVPIKVLLVDEQPIIREGLASLFEKYRDIQVIGQCQDYRNCLQLLETVEPDVIIADLAAESASSFELARRAKT